MVAGASRCFRRLGILQLPDAPREIASRVDYAHVLHKSSSLSDMIQRQLETGRAEEIAIYLKTHEQRFFTPL